MITPARTARINKARQVFLLIDKDYHVNAACREVGIPRSTFYDLCVKNPQICIDHQESLDEMSREEYFMLLTHKEAVLQKVLEDGLAETTKPGQRLAILKFVDETTYKLEDMLGISNTHNEEIRKLFGGPILVSGVSRFSASNPVVTVESEIDGDGV